MKVEDRVKAIMNWNAVRQGDIGTIKEFMGSEYIVVKWDRYMGSQYTYDGYGQCVVKKVLEPLTPDQAIKVGDTVRPTDGSWTITTKDGGLKATCGTAINKRDFVVMATGLNVPPIDYKGNFEKVEYPKGNVWVNDLAIKAIDNGEIVFINSKNVKLIPPGSKPVSFLEAVKAFADGKTIVCEMKTRYGDIKKYTYTPCNKCDFGFRLRADDACEITSGEILEGSWYVED